MEDILIITVFLLIMFAPMALMEHISRKKRENKKMNTYDYLNIYDAVLKQLEYVFRDSTLPPNMIDTMAHTRAVSEALELHRNKQLVPYYKRMKGGKSGSEFHRWIAPPVVKRGQV